MKAPVQTTTPMKKMPAPVGGVAATPTKRPSATEFALTQQHLDLMASMAAFDKPDAHWSQMHFYRERHALGEARPAGVLDRLTELKQHGYVVPVQRDGFCVGHQLTEKGAKTIGGES